MKVRAGAVVDRTGLLRTSEADFEHAPRTCRSEDELVKTIERERRSVPLISVCVCTYQRPDLLKHLLMSLAEQEGSNEWEHEIIVVDNDKDASGSDVIKELRRLFPGFPMTYEVEPQKNISLARNKTVALAVGDLVAFIDDDETADRSWLKNLYATLRTTESDAVFGPVIPQYPENCPKWIIKGRFFERPLETDGQRVYYGRTTNALVRARWLRMMERPFDPRYGLTGGEDSDLFMRIRREGAVFAWSEGGKVFECIGEARLNLRWLLMRAFRGGQNTAELSLKHAAVPRRFFHLVYRLALCGLALLIAGPLMLVRFHLGVWWLRKAFSNAGQLSIIFPYRYKEYK